MSPKNAGRCRGDVFFGAVNFPRNILKYNGWGDLPPTAPFFRAVTSFYVIGPMLWAMGRSFPLRGGGEIARRTPRGA